MLLKHLQPNYLFIFCRFFLIRITSTFYQSNVKIVYSGFIFKILLASAFVPDVPLFKSKVLIRTRIPDPGSGSATLAVCVCVYRAWAVASPCWRRAPPTPPSSGPSTQSPPPSTSAQPASQPLRSALIMPSCRLNSVRNLLPLLTYKNTYPNVCVRVLVPYITYDHSFVMSLH